MNSQPINEKSAKLNEALTLCSKATPSASNCFHAMFFCFEKGRGSALFGVDWLENSFFAYSPTHSMKQHRSRRGRLL